MTSKEMIINFRLFPIFDYAHALKFCVVKYFLVNLRILQ